MKRLTFLFLLAAASLCHVSSAMAHLHPNLQRFVQRDPAGYIEGSNLSLNEKANPIHHRDFSGLACGLGFLCELKNAPDGLICAAAQAAKYDHGSQGGVICVCMGRAGGGKLVACSWYKPKDPTEPSDVSKMISDCVVEHEALHTLGSGVCTPTNPRQERADGVSEKDDELPSYLLELGCLRDKRATCKTVECKAWMYLQWVSICDKINALGGHCDPNSMVP